MVDRNPHTGEALRSKPNSDNYRDNFDAIFGKKEVKTTDAKLDSAFARGSIHWWKQNAHRATLLERNIVYFARNLMIISEQLETEHDAIPLEATHVIWKKIE